MEEQIRRIEEMEAALNRAQAAVNALEQAWEEYLAVHDDIESLERYLGSSERRRDLDADENGDLPDGLHRGVLSEDAIWNLLEQNDALLKEIEDHCCRMVRKDDE